MFYVYVICNQDGRVYIGYIADLKDRIKESISLGCAELSAGLKAPSR
jgi:predicted GIY-YIG superfamily endonuclease